MTFLLSNFWRWNSKICVFFPEWSEVDFKNCFKLDAQNQHFASLAAFHDMIAIDLSDLEPQKCTTNRFSNVVQTEPIRVYPSVCSPSMCAFLWNELFQFLQIECSLRLLFDGRRMARNAKSLRNCKLFCGCLYKIVGLSLCACLCMCMQSSRLTHLCR